MCASVCIYILCIYLYTTYIYLYTYTHTYAYIKFSSFHITQICDGRAFQHMRYTHMLYISVYLTLRVRECVYVQCTSYIYIYISYIYLYTRLHIYVHILSFLQSTLHRFRMEGFFSTWDTHTCFTLVCIWLYVCASVCVYKYYMCIYIYVYHIYMYVHMYMYIYMYIYIYIKFSSIHRTQIWDERAF